MTSSAISFTRDPSKAMRIKDEKALNAMRDDIIDNHHLWVDVAIAHDPQGKAYKVLTSRREGKVVYLEEYSLMVEAEEG